MILATYLAGLQWSGWMAMDGWIREDSPLKFALHGTYWMAYDYGLSSIVRIVVGPSFPAGRFQTCGCWIGRLEHPLAHHESGASPGRVPVYYGT